MHIWSEEKFHKIMPTYIERNFSVGIIDTKIISFILFSRYLKYLVYFKQYTVSIIRRIAIEYTLQYVVYAHYTITMKRLLNTHFSKKYIERAADILCRYNEFFLGYLYKILSISLHRKMKNQYYINNVDVVNELNNHFNSFCK